MHWSRAQPTTVAALLVMGGQGHSRLREAFVGGVTKTVLDTMIAPVPISCR
jgi:nucleotide-binding universal stress UspA family protein